MFGFGPNDNGTPKQSTPILGVGSWYEQNSTF